MVIKAKPFFFAQNPLLLSFPPHMYTQTMYLNHPLVSAKKETLYLCWTQIDF